MNETTLQVKIFSESQIYQTKQVCNKEHLLDEETINGYVTVHYDDSWWLGHVLEKDLSKKEVKVSFLEPKGPSRSFVYPTRPDELTVPFCDILTRVQVSTQTGRTYALMESEQTLANNALVKKKS